MAHYGANLHSVTLNTHWYNPDLMYVHFRFKQNITKYDASPYDQLRWLQISYTNQELRKHLQQDPDLVEDEALLKVMVFLQKMKLRQGYRQKCKYHPLRPWRRNKIQSNDVNYEAHFLLSECRS